MAANSAGAGYYATLTGAQLDQDLGSDVVAVLTALDRAHRRYQQYWLPMGTDTVNGYQALKIAAGESSDQAATDFANASTAAALLEKLYQVSMGNATIAVDQGNGGNGAVTVGPNDSGFNFNVFLNRVAGDQLQ